MAELIQTHKNPDKTSLFFTYHFQNTRSLTTEEINILQNNGNQCSDPRWHSFYVRRNARFDPRQIVNCEFQGVVCIGNLEPLTIKYHDLELDCGLYNSYFRDVILGDNVCVRDVSYLVNYVVGNRVILFNIGEMSCTYHSKFGNGWVKSGEPESVRIVIGVGNENDKRCVLPFEDMIPADAYLWSRYREDRELMNCFTAMTERKHQPDIPTWGIVEDDCVVKNTGLIKDAKIGAFSYIKGALKLKNITICSSEREPSQVGEGVILVNGIVGYGSRIFYQAVAIRFVIGRNCQLKYGARLLNSVLGDNSTVSCCELLNNLLFPFHEQHHNTSFLIATTIQGQCNIAAGATIGSNHNSRSPDGEIYAGRGFWPGLSSDFKHNSKFASFTLVAKGSYQNELFITYPFSLVYLDTDSEQVCVMPAYWFLYNMFAIARNNSKFKNRDKRVIKVQHIETDPLAPDTIEEVLGALERIIELTGRTLELESYQKAKDYLHQNPSQDLVLEDPRLQSKYGGKVVKAASGYKEYRKIAKYFAVKSLITYCKLMNYDSLSREIMGKIASLPLYTAWENMGGQIIPQKQVELLFEGIKKRKFQSWEDVHRFYDRCQENYCAWKARYGLYVLEQLYCRAIDEFSADIYKDICKDVLAVSDYMYESSCQSREKDYTNFFRAMVYRNEEEMEAVLGTIQDVDFLHQLEQETKAFNNELQVLFSEIL